MSKLNRFRRINAACCDEEREALGKTWRMTKNHLAVNWVLFGRDRRSGLDDHDRTNYIRFGEGFELLIERDRWSGSDDLTVIELFQITAV